MCGWVRGGRSGSHIADPKVTGLSFGSLCLSPTSITLPVLLMDTVGQQFGPHNQIFPTLHCCGCNWLPHVLYFVRASIPSVSSCPAVWRPHCHCHLRHPASLAVPRPSRHPLSSGRQIRSLR